MWFILNAIFCGLNAWAYVEWHRPISLICAIFSGMVALFCLVTEI